MRQEYRYKNKSLEETPIHVQSEKEEVQLQVGDTIIGIDAVTAARIGRALVLAASMVAIQNPDE